MGAVRGLSVPSWGLFGVSWGDLGSFSGDKKYGILRRLQNVIFSPAVWGLWGPFGTSLGLLGCVLRDLGSLWGAVWLLLGPLEYSSGPLGGLLGLLGSLGGSWGLWGPLGSSGERILADKLHSLAPKI